MFRSRSPDITLIDLRMPGDERRGGDPSDSQLRQQGRFIVLTAYREATRTLPKALAADPAYLLKGMPHGELLQAIRSVHAAAASLPPAVMKSLR